MLERFKYLIFGMLIIAIISGLVVLLTYHPSALTLTIVPPAPTATAGPLHVYVTGAVVKPLITVEIPAGSRVQDAVQAAGGFTAEADQVAVNMAQVLRDGDQVHVPSINEQRVVMTATVPNQALALVENPVNINTADAATLERLPGVGPALATAIIEYRNQHGPFTSMADIDKIPGVGPATLEKWQGLIIFQ